MEMMKAASSLMPKKFRSVREKNGHRRNRSSESGGKVCGRPAPYQDTGVANSPLATAADRRLMALYLQARFRETGTTGKGRSGKGGGKGRPWKMSWGHRVAMLTL
jgi:hypothetical protein